MDIFNTKKGFFKFVSLLNYLWRQSEKNNAPVYRVSSVIWDLHVKCNTYFELKTLVVVRATWKSLASDQTNHKIDNKRNRQINICECVCT